MQPELLSAANARPNGPLRRWMDETIEHDGHYMARSAAMRCVREHTRAIGGSPAAIWRAIDAISTVPAYQPNPYINPLDPA